MKSDNLIENLQTHKRLWALTDDGEVFQSDHGILQPVLFEDLAAIVKLSTDPRGHIANHLMHWYDGNGAAKVFRYDDDTIVLERATSKNSLSKLVLEGKDDEATKIICDVASRLHGIQKTVPKYLVPLDVWFKPLTSLATSATAIFETAASLATDLLSTATDRVVLHGDLHHANVLDFGHRGWLAIDPKGLIGDRAFDFANILCNPNGNSAVSPGRLEAQVEIICSEARLERTRLLQWIVAWAALSAIWIIEEGGDPAVPMAVSSIGLRQLSS